MGIWGGMAVARRATSIALSFPSASEAPGLLVRNPLHHIGTSTRCTQIALLRCSPLAPPNLYVKDTGEANSRMASTSCHIKETLRIDNSDLSSTPIANRHRRVCLRECRFRTAMKLVEFHDNSLAVPNKLASALALATIISRGALQEHCVRQQLPARSKDSTAAAITHGCGRRLRAQISNSL